MEFPPYPNDEDSEQLYVYNLYRVEINQNGVSRPRVINFSTEKKMQVHIMEMVLMCQNLDKNFRQELVNHFDQYKKQYKNDAFIAFVTVFRKAQLENKQGLGFDIYWDEEPNVLL